MASWFIGHHSPTEPNWPGSFKEEQPEAPTFLGVWVPPLSSIALLQLLLCGPFSCDWDLPACHPDPGDEMPPLGSPGSSHLQVLHRPAGPPAPRPGGRYSRVQGPGGGRLCLGVGHGSVYHTQQKKNSFLTDFGNVGLRTLNGHWFAFIAELFGGFNRLMHFIESKKKEELCLGCSISQTCLTRDPPLFHGNISG